MEGWESREEESFLPRCSHLRSFYKFKSVVETPKRDHLSESRLSQLTAFKFEFGVRGSPISRLIVLEIQGQNLM